MKAISYKQFGSAGAVLECIEMDIPRLKPNEVLIKLSTSGVNPSDIRARAGGRPSITRPPFPEIIPHSDGAGIIEAVGEKIETARLGERVWIWNGQWQRAFGTAAEYITLPSEQAVHLPDNVSFDVGATLGIPALTACHTVLGAGDIEGKTLLISGGNGTVGHIAVQIAKAAGAQVIATASENSFDSVEKAGADKVFNYAAPDLATQILDYTRGQLVERIVEAEFGKNIQTNADIIAPCGSIATIGSALEMTPVLPFYPLLFKAVNVNFVLVYLLNTVQRQYAINQLNLLLEQNQLDIRIAKRFNLADCAKAHELIESGQRAGSVILKI